jgi:hypothetical protein
MEVVLEEEEDDIDDEIQEVQVDDTEEVLQEEVQEAQVEEVVINEIDVN